MTAGRRVRGTPITRVQAVAVRVGDPVAVIEARLHRRPAMSASRRTRTVSVRVAPAGTGARLHTSRPPESRAPTGRATRDMPSGRMSVTRTPRAGAVPRLVTRIR